MTGAEDVIDEISWLLACSGGTGEFSDADAYQGAELLAERAGELAGDALSVGLWLAQDSVLLACAMSEPAKTLALIGIRSFAEAIAERLRDSA